MERLRRLARDHHLEFMRHTWLSVTEPFTVGYHTRAICERLDRAIEDFRAGISTYLRISVHPRAGKSRIVSVYLPPRFLALFPDKEMMAVSYNKEKAQEFARESMRLVRSPRFREVFPTCNLGREAMGSWSLTVDGDESAGKVYSSGLSSGLTGYGYHLGILDDFCASRAEAESPTLRARMWDSFTNDFMTRRAPVSITVVLATQWHHDDLHGRIARKNNPAHEDYDPEFPVFEHLSFPARRELAEHPECYPGEFLFLERFSAEWYQAMYATLGPYAASAMMDCRPSPRSGHILDVGKVVWHQFEDDFPKDIVYYRVWDYAHSAKQRTGSDPDYTGGTLLGFRPIGYNTELREKVWEIWVKDYTQFRHKAPERDTEIKKITRADGPQVRVLVESSVDSMDGAEYLRHQLLGLRSMEAVHCKGDKVVRCAPLEPIFTAGHVHVLRRSWRQVWEDGIRDFDGTGKSHDEMVDNLTCAYQHVCGPRGYQNLRDPYR